KQTCGKTTVEFDERCNYACNCSPNGGCHWSVGCPDGKGGTITTSGTGLTAKPPKFPSVVIAGTLEGGAMILAKMWKRSVTVPPKLRRRRIRRRTLRGTPDEIAHTLGLQLGPKRRT